ncbi:hypothetical protein [Cohnella thailandensis]|uniref:Uncharacterized protein n=1 Tax=Cohnella thailandensis TaxID=557557 RepID=A0A841T519_9BACL|nr:hypothetical protein [Cohnella thailandensis]MBB6637418.1 hypothetical protein [Cohnella thailandensis]MBP1976748.1 hypothetical protein [Cohnella thailandensis]
MKLLMILAAFAAVLFRGWTRSGNEDGKGKEKALYTVFVVYSAYIVLAGTRPWPLLTPVRLFRAFFVPLGRWLEWALAGG